MIKIEGTMTDENGTTIRSFQNKTITISARSATNDNEGANSGGATTPTETPVPSNNANLSNLGIRTYDFKGFRAANTSYNASVPNEVTSVEVYANVQAAGAKYSVSGNTNLQVGTNRVTITVTAPDGKTTKNYYIYVARQPGEEQPVIPNVIEEPENPEEPEEDKKEKIGLISIAIDEEYEIYLEPEFKTDVYEYVINLKEDLDSIPITAIANRENAEVKITGNEDLEEGENVITIEVTDPVLEETTVYTIKVNKIIETEADIEEQEDEKTEKSSFFRENWMIIAAIVVAILLIATSIIGAVIMKKNREDRMFFKEDYDIEEEEIEEKSRRGGRHY